MDTQVKNSRLFNWIITIAWAAAIFVMSSQSAPPEPSFKLPPYTDKIIHALIFALLANLLFRSLYLTGFSKMAAVIGAIVLTSLYGVSDEWHQSMVPGRTPDLYDWVADTVGAFSVLFISRRKI